MDSADRADFLAGLKPGGKYEGIVGFYRHNVSSAQIGLFDREIIDGLAAAGVKWIAHNGAGYDQIDVLYCKEKGAHIPTHSDTYVLIPRAIGIFVSNTPGAVDDATATTALFLLISALRCFSKAERSVRVGQWKNAHVAGEAHDLTGRTLAILGMGGIGLRLAHLVHAFPMRVIYHNRRKVPHAPEWCEYYGSDRLDEFLANAEVLSVHVPLNDQTTGLVDENMIRKLPKGAVIVNTARGKVIDEAAMIRALEDGHVRSQQISRCRS